MRRSSSSLYRAACTVALLSMFPIQTLVAVLSAEPAYAATQCEDGVDSDGDGRVDSADPGCHSDGNPYNAASYIPGDNDESFPANSQCNDYHDDDGDNLVDYPADPGCADAFDNDERDMTTAPACSDSRDNDGDQRVDTLDPGCHSDANPGNAASYVASDNDESSPGNTQCNDAADNDGDGQTDFPGDAGCADAFDNDEGGGAASSSTTSSSSTSASGACSDGQDNDNDTRIDAADPGCHSDGNPYNSASYLPNDASEATPANSQCNDYHDDDGDNLVDYPADPGCADAFDNDERNAAVSSSSTTSSSTSSSSQAPEDLIARYTFDDGTASDVSGNNRHGTPELGAVVQNGCMRFDGADDRVRVPNFDRQVFSFMAWAKREEGGAGWTPELMTSKNPGGWGLGYMLPHPSHNEAGKLHFSHVEMSHVSTDGQIQNPNGFHHIAVTYDGASVRFYVDGQLDSVKSFPRTFNSGGDVYYMGWHHPHPPKNYTTSFKGLMDDVRVYGRVLSQADIQNAALLRPTCEPQLMQCNDGADNDGDTRVDSADPGCHSDGNPYNAASYQPTDNSESAPANSQCNDYHDDDGDNLVDYPADPGCADAFDNDERNAAVSSSSTTSSSSSAVACRNEVQQAVLVDGCASPIGNGLCAAPFEKRVNFAQAYATPPHVLVTMNHISAGPSCAGGATDKALCYPKDVTTTGFTIVCSGSPVTDGCGAGTNGYYTMARANWMAVDPNQACRAQSGHGVVPQNCPNASGGLCSGHFSTQVTFTTPYDSVPKVLVAAENVSNQGGCVGGATDQVACYPENVTKTGFTLRCSGSPYQSCGAQEGWGTLATAGWMAMESTNQCRVQSQNDLHTLECPGGVVNQTCATGFRKTVTFPQPFSAPPKVIVSTELATDSTGAGASPCAQGATDAYKCEAQNVTATGFTAVCYGSPEGAECGAAQNGSTTGARFGYMAIEQSCAQGNVVQPAAACGDGVDNDGDQRVDALDPGCHSDGNPGNSASYVPSDSDESSPGNTQCNDAADNDADGLKDYPQDPGCSDPMDNSEANATGCTYANNAQVIEQINAGKIIVGFDVRNGRMTVQNNAACSFPGSISVFQMFGNNQAGNQRYWSSSEVKTVSPGQTVVFQATPPSCNSQLDLFYGEPIRTEVPASESTWGQKVITGATDMSHPSGYCPFPRNDATCVIHGGVPQSVAPGQSFPVTFRVKNTGVSTWKATPDVSSHKLGSNDPIDNSRWGFARVQLPHDVAPGVTVDLQKTAVAPTTPGTYSFKFQMLQESYERFGQECSATITVGQQTFACNDGRDNDGDQRIDTLDPGCHSDGNPGNSASYVPTDNDEASPGNTQCNDAADNDGDGLKDYQQDPGCGDPMDNDERNAAVTPECSDGRDNDADGFNDTVDPGCDHASDPTESGETCRSPKVLYYSLQSGHTPVVGVGEMLRGMGYDVTIGTRQTQPTLTDAYLRQFDVVWFNNGCGGPTGLPTDAELTAIRDYYLSGRHLILTADDNKGDATQGSGDCQSRVNRIANKLGVNYSGMVLHQSQSCWNVTGNHPLFSNGGNSVARNTDAVMTLTGNVQWGGTPPTFQGTIGDGTPALAYIPRENGHGGVVFGPNEVSFSSMCSAQLVHNIFGAFGFKRNCPTAYDLSADLQLPPQINRGDMLPETWKIANVGSGQASSASASQTLPSGFVFNPALSSPQCSAVGSVVTCSTSNLGPGQTATFQVYVQVPTSHACGTNFSTSITTSPGDGNAANNSDSASTLVTCPAGSSSSTTSSSSSLAACGDGLDNDNDGLVDVLDPGCANSGDVDEGNPAACREYVYNAALGTRPENQGWNGGVSVSGVHTEGSIKYVRITDNSTTTGFGYSRAIAQSDLIGRDWTYEIVARIRASNHPTKNPLGMNMFIAAPGLPHPYNSIYFNVDRFGPVGPGETYSRTAFFNTSDAFHRYEIRYKASTNTFSIYRDGQLAIADVTPAESYTPVNGESGSTPMLAFFVGSTSGTGEFDAAYVRYSTTDCSSPQAADLSALIDLPPQINRGGLLPEKLTAKNVSGVASGPSTLTQTIPAGFVFNAQYSNPACSSNGSTVTCAVPSLGPGQEANFWVYLHVPANQTCNSTVTTQSKITPNAGTDPNPGNDTSPSDSVLVTCG